MAERAAYLLASVPECTWASARAAAQADQWVWSDLNGVQLTATLPESAPYTNLVLGWGRDRWYRWRLVADRVVGAELRRSSEPAAESELVVNVSVHTGKAWAETEQRIGFRGPGSSLRDAPLDILHVPGRHPLVFVGARR